MRNFWLLEIRIGNRADDTGRVARSNRVGGDIFGNDGAGADDNAITQGDAFENDGAGANKTAATNLYWLGVFGVFGKPGEFGARGVKIVIEHHTASP